MKTPGPRPIALGAVLSLGAFLRLIEYFGNRTLWLDEAMLALGIGRRGYLGLLAPLDYDQVSAPLFLWAVKTVTLIGGMGELALRIVPLLAGVMLPWVVWRMTRSLGGPAAGLIAAVLAAISVPLIYHSAELKPYGLDALVSASVIGFTLRTREAPEHPNRWGHLLLAGMVGLLLSIPLPLVLAGTLAALLADRRVRAVPGFHRRLIGLAVVWAGWFGVLHGLIYRFADTRYMHQYWAGTFLDPRAPDAPLRLYGTGMAILDPLPPIEGIIPFRWCLLLAVAGTILLIRRAGLPGALQIGLPFLALILASALGLYPIAPRLLVFLAPALMAFVGVMLAELLRMVRLGESVAAIAGALLIVIWGGPEVLENARHPQIREEGRRTARHVARAALAEPVYVTPSGIPSWGYYTTDWARADTVRLDFVFRVGTSSGPAAFNDLVVQAPVHGEDQPPTYAGAGRVEMLGRRSGMSFREPNGFDQTAPDPTWAGAEVDRIVEVARPHAWVYAGPWKDREFPALRAEFARRGIVIVEMIEEADAMAVRIRASAPLPPRAHTAPP
jgi:dolichyl-phosphate-mannose-protein mannosyltransferase